MTPYHIYTIFGTMEICLRYGLFKLLRSIVPGQKASGDNLGKIFLSSTQ